MRFHLIFICSLLLSACVRPHAPTLPEKSLTEIEVAEKAISIQDWDAAYRFLEDQFISDQEDVKFRAIKLADKYPQIIIAGANTFSQQSILGALSVMSEKIGEGMVRRRLESYKAVATQQAYQMARVNFDSAVRFLADQKDEKVRQQKDAIRAMVDAKEKSRIICQSRVECEKAFALTQIYISENSEMKIQMANETVIETFNPSESTKIGLKAIKIPMKGDTSEIVLTVNCGSERGEVGYEICYVKRLSAYRNYPMFIESMLSK